MTNTNKTIITQKGQVTIPKHIRDYLGLKIKTKVEFLIEKGKVIIQPATSLEASFGKIRAKKKPEDFKAARLSFEKAVAKEASEEK